MTKLAFPIILTHPSIAFGRTHGQVTVSHHSLDVSWEGGSLSLPLEGLKLHCGGANNALLFISHPLHPEWTVFTRERGLVRKLDEVAGETSLKTQLRALSTTRRRILKGTLLALGCVALGIWAIFALKDPALDLVVKAIPRSWEQKLGEAVFFGVKAQTPLLEDSEVNQEFQKLIAPIMSVVQDSGYTFNVHISKDQELNAFALPGGIIVVQAGTILQAARPEELLGVLAHEISHVTRRHTTKQAITVFGLYFVVDAMFGNFFGTVAALSQGAVYLLQQGFSRDLEQEADVEGLRLLRAARIDPMGLVEFFNRLKVEHEKVPVVGQLEKQFSFLSTHPATDERIAYLTAKIKEETDYTYQPLSEDGFRAFKEKLRSKL